MTILDIRSLDPGTHQYLESWWTYIFNGVPWISGWDWINHHTLLVNLTHFQWSIVEKCHVQRYFCPILVKIPRFVSSKNSKKCNDPGCPDLDVYILHIFFRVSKSKMVLKIPWDPTKRTAIPLADFLQNLFLGQKSLEIEKKKVVKFSPLSC